MIQILYSMNFLSFGHICLPFSHSRKSFLCYNELESHLSEDKPYQQSQCDKAFSVKRYLDPNMMTHIGEKPYQCSQCENTFTENENLKWHMIAHSEEKPYQCSQCEQAFIHNVDLKHMSVHSENPYISSQSDKDFSVKTTRIGEKHYQCSHCGKSFTWHYKP